MKERYQNPSMEIIVFDNEDVIATSDGTLGYDGSTKGGNETGSVLSLSF